MDKGTGLIKKGELYQVPFLTTHFLVSTFSQKMESSLAFL
ncbi:hypothetical protein HSISS3_1824 [Streptococcus sp. HSISS3]|nr:hypothetical protein HSISS3_1824 [Streptococcus sp. HSISS3]